jgi:hypothetical protein
MAVSIFRAKIYKVNYDTVPCTIDYQKYNFAQDQLLPNNISFSGDQIIHKIKVDFGGGTQYRPKVGDFCKIEIDDDGKATAHPLDFARAVTLENDGDIIVSNFISNTSVLCHKDGITINANDSSTINVNSDGSIVIEGDTLLSFKNASGEINIDAAGLLQLKNTNQSLFTLLNTLLTTLIALKTGLTPATPTMVIDTATSNALATLQTNLATLLKA